jgi:hypothetical protein
MLFKNKFKKKIVVAIVVCIVYIIKIIIFKYIKIIFFFKFLLKKI